MCSVISYPLGLEIDRGRNMKTPVYMHFINKLLDSDPNLQKYKDTYI